MGAPAVGTGGPVVVVADDDDDADTVNVAAAAAVDSGGSAGRDAAADAAAPPTASPGQTTSYSVSSLPGTKDQKPEKETPQLAKPPFGASPALHSR